MPDKPDYNSPVVNIGNPADGSRVSRTVQIRAIASDDVSITSVNLYIDSSLKASSSIGPLDYSWNTRKVSNGIHTIKAVVVGGANNLSEALVQVTKGSSSSGRGGSKGGKGRKK